FFSYQNRSRENRSSRSALFDDGLEEGGLRASSSFSSEIKEHDNDRAIDSLQDRVRFLKSLTGDIHEEVESHNRLLDRMGNGMDVSRGVISGTMDRFKAVCKLDLSGAFTSRQVFEKKSSRRTCVLAGFFVLSFFAVYCLIRFLRFFM
ncbi:Bet1-like SNARE 1-2, partial [Linum grandiflorum]